MKRERFAYLIPLPGKCIPVPEVHFRLMPTTGERVRMTPYYDRMIADGVLVEGTDPDASVASPVEPEPASKASKAKP
jgi:hypothetical protein